MRQVFVLGAGASAASAQTPLGSQLGWSYHKDCTLLKTIVNGEPDLRQDSIKFSNYERFLEVIEFYFPELKGVLEKFWNRGEAFFQAPRFPEKKYYIDEILRIVQEKNDNEARKLIKKLIFEHLTDPIFRRRNGLYEDFIAKVLKSKRAGTASLISFNFDVLLHEDFKNGIFFDYLIDFDWVHPRLKIDIPNSIPLIKLNGSLDWGICERCKQLHLCFYSVQRGFYDQQRCSCEGTIEPFIIMPHEEYDDKINILWSKAERELKLAQRVTIIGYSFPDYDQEAINLFKTALNENVELEVVDYCEANIDKTYALKQTKEKYARLFPHCRKETQISLDGFSTFLNNYQAHQRP